MWKIAPPFLEVSFYFAETPDSAALLRLLRVLTSHGAQFGGSGMIHRGAGINARPFGGVTDEQLERIALTGIDDAETYATGADTRLMQVLLTDATAASRRAHEILTYTRISDEAAEVDHHPIALWTSGVLFDGPDSDQGRGRLRRRRALGLRVYTRFLDLIRALRPTYASLTIEVALECPTDLRRDARTYAFRDFYTLIASCRPCGSGREWCC